MAIKRYTANKDNTITNSYESDLLTRATGSNMGAADSLEVFSIYGQQASGSSELARALVQFPVDDIITDRSGSAIPSSGSVDFYLRMFNAKHPFTLPRNFTLVAAAVTQSWEEGIGLDMDEYKDTTHGVTGSDWIMAEASSGTKWGRCGGSYFTDASSTFTQHFEKGTEDLEMNITPLVEQWMNFPTANVFGHKSNYGVGIFLTSSQEAYFLGAGNTDSGSIPHNADGVQRSYYTKKFFSRTSEFFYKRPIIEARWDDSKKDDRGNFHVSSAYAYKHENLHTLWLYNSYRGRLQDIPGTEDRKQIYLKLFTSASNGGALYPVGSGSFTTTTTNTVVTGGWVETGVYSASFALDTSASTVYDVWYYPVASGDYVFHTSSFKPIKGNAVTYNPHTSYVTTINNLKASYSNKSKEKARFRLYIREKDWNPNIYTVASAEAPDTKIVENAYYKVTRAVDKLEVVGFGTGSSNKTGPYTRLSYDISGNYFDFSMDLLEPGYKYNINFLYKMPNNSFVEQEETFSFRVE